MKYDYEFNLFTDGSSLIRGIFYESSSACVLCPVNAHKPIMACGGYHIDGTISIGESSAVLMGLSMVRDAMQKLGFNKVKVNVYMDSAFVKDSLNKWIKGWSKVGRDATWINSQNKPVACQDTFKEIYYDYMKAGDMKVKCYHLNGHIGEKIKVKDAYIKFLKRNDVEMTREEFDILVKGNHEVDGVAELVRVNRLYKYNKIYLKGGDKQCCLYLKDRRIRISSRKRK